ncbi:hypothetical protein HYT57_03580 [Candidatus Woesearchaeota archaeon]|nr:hypothetical protein [Candidatus Woesearchaeota archaeon]
MVYIYDLRLTVRELGREPNILRQYYMENISFPNSIHVGEDVRLNNSKEPNLSMKVLGVEHLPLLLGKSMLTAETSFVADDLPNIESVLSRYNPIEF